MRAIWRKFRDLADYYLDRVRLYPVDLTPFSHFVASREGLYAVGREGSAKVADGQFYGLTVRGSSVFLFGANDTVWSRSRRGRILKLQLAGGGVRSARVWAKGLDNGCHQIDFIAGDLHVVDTYNQAILRLGADGSKRTVHFPIPPAGRDRWDEGYAHVNSIVAHGGELFLLKANGGTKTGKRSEVVRCTAELEPIETFSVPGLMCHNIVFLEDGEMLVCGSMEGTIVNRHKVVLRVGEMLTRGLSVDAETLVVGDSMFSTRHERRFVPGNVYFYDRDYRLQAQLAVPAAPTEIRRIDGRDLSLSDFAA